MTRFSLNPPKWSRNIFLILSIFLLFASTLRSDDSKVTKMVTTAKNEIPGISCVELTDFINSQIDLQILDVRTQVEYDQGHLAGALWIPRGKLEFEILKGNLAATDRLTIVYCKLDGRASLAAKTLHDLGFTNIRYLESGFKAWVESGRSIYNMHGELTVKNFEKKRGGRVGAGIKS